MLTIQKYISKILFYQNKRQLRFYKELKEHQHLTIKELKEKQLIKLNNILNHAYENVPYYHDILINSTLVQQNKIALNSLNQLSQIPILTKDDIFKAGDSIYSVDHITRKSYHNTSGGSTGVPVRFIQDKYYYDKSAANFMLVKSWRGSEYYDSYIHLWGAVRDTYKGKKPIDMYVRDFLRNRIILNSSKMDSKIMSKYLEIINKHQTNLIIAYVQSMYELARFADQNNIEVKKQNAIHTSAGTLFDYMREEIEKVFQCDVYNHYGSREVGPIASECKAHNGLHILMDHLIVETIDTDSNTCPPGEEGEILITTLNNYSMPLIRYKIDDKGILKEDEKCICGCNYSKIERILGRSGDNLITKRNEIISAEYLTLTFNYLDGVKQFQIIQKEFDHILIKIVKDENFNNQILSIIEKKMIVLMGQDCRIQFEFPQSIQSTPTGKYRYTICEIK